MFLSKKTLPELDQSIQKTFEGIFGGSSGSQLAQKCCPGKPQVNEGHLPEGIRFLGSKWIEILGYLIILHYASDEILSVYLHLDLQDFLERNNQFYWTSVLVDRELFLRYLKEQMQISERDFFGNICCKKNLYLCWSQILIRFENRIRPKRVQRHRGYRDKGTLPSYDLKVLREELSEDSRLTEIQIRKELTKKVHQQDILLLEEHLRGGRILSDALMCKFRITRR
jgi:hypothetical protein